ncbi:MAG TPA: radical SAM protein [Nanoarchaeota archaeon]|nr:radical SAM protein [Nanoarchaeota archaeon]
MEEKILILQSGKCAWGKCYACGWGKIDYGKPDLHKLKRKIDEFFRKVSNIDRVKIFCSGSFFDENQFPKVIREYIAKKCKEKNVKELVVESRPEFIKEEIIKPLTKYVNLVVAIGLEAADNKILEKYQKGFYVEDYIKACELLKKLGCKIRTYLMVNLPFVENNEEILEKSFKIAKKYSDEIVIINTFPHSNSQLFNLWIEGKWKPLDKKEFEKLVKPYKKYKNVEFDFNNFAFEPKFPKSMQKPLKGVGKEFLIHPYYEIWQDYICRFYEKPKEKEYALFIPCTYTKPYYKSKLHKEILKIVPKNFHLIVISSPGVIPYEFVDKYPFNAYDWPEWEETEEIKKLYIKVTQKRIENYLKTHKYKKYFAFLKPNSESFIALKKACEKLGIKLKLCVSNETWEKIKERKNPLLSNEALKDLKKCIEE